MNIYTNEIKRRLAESKASLYPKLNLSFLKVKGIKNIAPIIEFKHIKSLSLRSNQISDIRFLENMTQLKSLNLSDNQISDIRFLEKLTQLQYLNLSSNQISDIRFLEKLTQLQYLDLRSNQVSDIRFLKNMTQLKSLDLSSNQVSDIRFLKNMTQLKSLYLSDNHISDIRFLENMTQLKSLYLNDNQVSDIRFLENMTQLKSLYLSDNKIQKISAWTIERSFSIAYEYGWPTNTMTIHNNPITSPPLEIVQQGHQAIKNWFKAQKAQLNEIKIILIGDPKAGKTSLLKRLKDNTFNEKETQTDGINIETVDFGKCPTFKNQASLKDIKAYFWDFGGQEIMNATHQFFLTKRSIYILVLDARKDSQIANQIRQWLSRIQASAGNSSIIIVCNKIDINPGFGFENEFELQKEFPQIKYFIKISCKSSKNLYLLKLAIADLVPKAEFFNTEIDERWIFIKNQLQKETKAENYLSEKRFIEICQFYQLHQKEERLQAIRFLHDLGLVLHFEHIHQDLSEYYVLDPYWITYGVYQILTSQFAAEMQGEIPMDQLDFIINEEEDKKSTYEPSNYRKIQYSTNERRFLVDILHQFKLCFYLPNRSHFILPDLLDSEEPITHTKVVRETNNKLNFIYEYNYLPKSVLPYLMVETNRCLYYKWRTGCIIVLFDCLALISSYGNRLIIMVVGEGKQKRELLAVVRSFIEHVNHQLNLNPEKLIPLPNDLGHVDYNDLLEMEKDGETFYRIYRPVKEKFRISKLLDGISKPSPIEYIHAKLDRIHDKQCTIEANQKQGLANQEHLSAQQQQLSGQQEEGLKNQKKILHQGQKTLQKLSDLLDNQSEMKNDLGAIYKYLMEQLGNEEFEGVLESTIRDLAADQSNQIDQLANDVYGFLTTIIIELDKELEQKLKTLYDDLKKSDNVEMKLKLGLPLIHLLGIDLEVKYDIKPWCKKMYEKYGLEVFRNMPLV